MINFVILLDVQQIVRVVSKALIDSFGNCLSSIASYAECFNWEYPSKTK